MNWSFDLGMITNHRLPTSHRKTTLNHQKTTLNRRFMFAIGRLCFAQSLMLWMNVLLQNQIKQLQDVSLRETYPIPHLALVELHHLSYGLPCHTWNSTALVACSDFRLQELLSGRALPCKVISQPTLELVHSVRLEQLGEGLPVCSGETVAAHWVDEPVAEASASRSSGATHWWVNHTRVSEERPWLRQARLGVASQRLSQEQCFPLAILLHLFDLDFNNDSLVNHLLEILVVSIDKLELNLIIEPIQEGILFLFICINLIRCISWHLSEFIEVLIHSHSVLL
jgi:hypothetical protein